MVFQCKNYSEITVETRTQLKSVIFTTDIFAVLVKPLMYYMYASKYEADNLLKSMHVLGLLSDELLAV